MSFLGVMKEMETPLGLGLEILLTQLLGALLTPLSPSALNARSRESKVKSWG